MCPSGNNPNRPGHLVHQNSRVSHSILRRRQTTIFPERQEHTHLLPRLSPIRAAAQTDVNPLLQIRTAVITDVIHPQKRPLASSHQTGYAESSRPIVTGMAHAHPHPVDNLPLRGQILQANCRSVCLHFLQLRPHPGSQRRVRFHLQTDPKEMRAFRQRLVNVKENVRLQNLRPCFQHRITGQCSPRLSCLISREVSIRRHRPIALGRQTVHSSVIQLQRTDSTGRSFHLQPHPVQRAGLVYIHSEIKQHIILSLKQNRDLRLPHPHRVGSFQRPQNPEAKPCEQINFFHKHLVYPLTIRQSLLSFPLSTERTNSMSSRNNLR